MKSLRLKVLTMVVACGLLLASGVAHALTLEEIMDKVDANTHYVKAYARAEMVIRSGRREMTKEMISWTEGSNSLVEFTNRSDRGTKYLKLEDELWMFFPDAEDLVLISGHMLKQGFMGSDMSYEDMLQSEKMTELYDFELLETEILDDREMYVIEATAKLGKEVSYANRKMWIDTETLVGMREELYALNGRLLKVSSVEETQRIGDRNYPTVIVMEDMLRRDTRTIMRILEIDFDRDIPENLFSLQSLMR